MKEPHELLRRDALTDDALALLADATKAEGRADALAAMPNGCPRAVRAEAARLRRASDVALMLAGFDDNILDALATGSMQKMLHETRQAERRRKALGGGR
ncbi:UNVERIFIED_CONTAM: hypothetical protein Q9R58_17795 [Methylobacteriaceae bacterium AG10]|nr:hypothetical protein [Methylobacteriaceae bacterium AG10]